MDGNGRWAEARGLSRVAGHARGARRVSEIVKACPDLGVTHLTLFAFSTENWRRPLAEVEGLMRIFRQYIVAKAEGLRRNDVRVRFIGMRHRVPAQLRDADGDARGAHRRLPRAEPDDRHRLRRPRRADPGGARGCRTRWPTGRLARGGDRRGGASRRRSTPATLPDPDFIIRTSGELRISNFLLWQGVYAEYDFPETAWPDFTVAAWPRRSTAYQARQRRFGQVGAAGRAAISQLLTRQAIALSAGRRRSASVPATRPRPGGG